jgi:hypothetical protein
VPCASVPPPKCSMASGVKTRTVPGEDFLSLQALQPEPLDSRLADCTATFSIQVSVRDCTKQLSEVKGGQPLAWANRLRALRAPQKLLRAPRRPGKTRRSYSEEPSQLGKRLDARAASGRSSRCSLGLGSNAGDVSGANQTGEVGNSDAVRRLGLLTVPLLGVRTERSSLAASVRMCNSPTRPACSLYGSFMTFFPLGCLLGSSQGTARPSRRYRSSTAS